MSDLKKWLEKCGYLEKTLQIKNPTHLLLDGGKVYLPENMEKEFLENYSEELRKKSKLYYVETRSKVFKYMIDLDIGDDHYWTNLEIIDIVKFVNEIINQFYDSKFTVICCTAPPKNKGKLIGTGIHLIWPKLFVTTEIAIMFRNAILEKINNDDPSIKFAKRDLNIQNSWEDAFDGVIYTRNGYRMVGSDKLNPKTRVPENRLYKPLYAIDGNSLERKEYIDRLNNDPFFLMLETSIRYIPETFRKVYPNGMKPKKIPDWASDNIKNPIKRENVKISLDSGGEQYAVIEYFIRKQIPEYSREKKLIRDIRENPDGSLYVSSDSKYCMNIGKEHNSCGIYFHITREGVFQKCFCPCDNLRGRKHGYCKDYTSECYKIPDKMVRLLYQDVKFRKVEEEEKVGKAEENTLAPFVQPISLKEEKKEEKKDKDKDKEKREKKPGKRKKTQSTHYVHGADTEQNLSKVMHSDFDNLYNEVNRY